MILDIIFWIALIYIVLFIIVKLEFAIEMFRVGYHNRGLLSAFKMGLVGFLDKVRGGAKIRLMLAFLAIIISSYYGNNYLGIFKPYLKSDTDALMYFIDSYESNNSPEYTQELERFCEQINQYSSSGIYKLKYFSRCYITYINSLQEDFNNILSSYNPGDLLSFEISTKTDSIRMDLLKYDVRDKIELDEQTIMSSIQKINDELLTSTEAQQISFKENLIKITKMNQSNFAYLMESVYQIIFNESYSQ